MPTACLLGRLRAADDTVVVQSCGLLTNLQVPFLDLPLPFLDSPRPFLDFQRPFPLLFFDPLHRPFPDPVKTPDTPPQGGLIAFQLHRPGAVPAGVAAQYTMLLTKHAAEVVQFLLRVWPAAAQVRPKKHARKTACVLMPMPVAARTTDNVPTGRHGDDVDRWE